MATSSPSFSSGPRRLSPVASIEDRFTVAAVHENLEHATLPLPLLSSPSSALAASYRVLAQRVSKRGDTQVIAVTSARAGEGKTTLSLNLGAALAELRDKRVLVIEANRARPAISAGLGFEVPDCFEAQLSRAHNDARVFWNTVGVLGEQLQVLAVAPGDAGQAHVTPRAYRRLLGEARRQYGHIIVDCPAVDSAGDVSVVEDLADGTLFAARAGSTRARDIRRAMNMLDPANVLGVVLSDGEV